MPRCLSEGVDIFLKSAERQGESGHDVRVSRSAPWMACVGGPVMMRTAISLFVENSHLETRHQGVMFRSLRAFVGSMATLRYEPCTQFINVSQRALHIYWQFSAMSLAIHKIVSKRRYQSYFQNFFFLPSLESFSLDPFSPASVAFFTAFRESPVSASNCFSSSLASGFNLSGVCTTSVT